MKFSEYSGLILEYSFDFLLLNIGVVVVERLEHLALVAFEIVYGYLHNEG